LALAISLTLDPMAATTDPGRELLEEPAAAKEPKPPDPVEPVVIPESKQATEPSRREPVTTPVQTPKDTRLSLQAGLLGSISWVPAFSPAAELGLVLRHQRWSLGFDAVTVARQTQTSAAGSSVGVSLAYAVLAPCSWVSALGVCALATLGRYAGQGAGVDAPRAGNHLHAAAGARVQMLLPLSTRWSLGMNADGVMILTRPQFVVAGQEVFRPTPWAANLGVFASFQLL
jgi:hypothetical protein